MNHNNFSSEASYKSEASYILLDDFALCNLKLDKGWIGIHEVDENKGLYYYLYSGSPKVGIAFENTMINLTKGALTSTKQHLDKSIILEATDDCDMIIFNTIEKSQDWSGSLITSKEQFYTFTCDNANSYLICLDGAPIVNSKNLQKFDYSKLTLGKEYTVTLNNGVLGLFTKLVV